MKPRYIVEAEALLGQKEIHGRLANEKIKELYKDAGHPEIISDEVPWCAAFVSACLARANQPHTDTLLARDYRSEGWLKNAVDFGKKPQLYSIGVMARGQSKWEGHVGFVVKFDKDNVWLLGGNQRDSVSVMKFPKASFLGFSAPKEKAMDVAPMALIDSSRRMTFQRYMEWLQTTLAAAMAGVWTYGGQIMEYAKDKAGWLVLGTVAATWLGLKIIGGMSRREYAEGRYLPNSQWKEEDNV